MGTKMVSLRVDEGLLEWATGYARERGVSRTSVVEAALRDFRESCARGVPDLEDERVPRPIASAPRCTCDRDTIAENMARPGCPVHAPVTPPASVVPPVRRLSRSKQSELAMARMRRMDPRRYG